ncbi:uncharacterized protein LOC102718134 [Oryza brachyantha]|uniref:Uncharacterized protein n=1 Tax=Oryza brachyantha TaxID=4533 RepID=J3KZM6_ORYBR|nr:uncharacterized protein LOC102718134 [Oryza brachyantha]
MDALMNRSRVFAEAVVIMVCPVLLAVALHKVDLKSKEHGQLAVPILMLAVAAVTLASGVVPFLALAFSKSFSNHAWRLPAKAASCLAPFSCMCLVGLACWIMHLIVSQSWGYAFPATGGVFLLCIVVRSVRYCRARGDALPVAVGARDALWKAMEGKLDDSLEFLAGVTALLFLGLEALALEGQTNGGQSGRLAGSMGVCFFACVVGVCFMLVETIPPPPPGSEDTGCRASVVRNLTAICDIFMASAITAVMMTIMIMLVNFRALLLLSPLFLMLLVHAFGVRRGGDDGDGDDAAKPASLELSKVTFTGFLAVSIPAIKKPHSIDISTELFLMCAASGIVSGLAWRLLTHARMGRNANVASFCTHFCIAIATVPFTVMAGNAL